MSVKPTLALLLPMTLVLAGCGGGELTCSTEHGRQAIVKEVDADLSKADCTSALSVIETYYPQQDCATDEIRLARASANACIANVNFFQFVSDLGNNSIIGSDLWVTLTKLFPSASSDQRVTGAQNALDALFAIKIPGTIDPPASIINGTTPHPGTLVASHRTEDSNIYGMIVSMAAVGALQNRYGAPAANWHKTQKLGQTTGNPNGWEDATQVDVYACTYAGAVLTLVDSIVQVSSSIGSSFGSSIGGDLTAAATTYSLLFNAACDAGCTACGLGAGTCDPCPITLRNRNSCTGLATDVNSCAAAGIASFMDTNALGWPN